MAPVRYTYHDFINDLVNCRNRAKEMRSLAENAHDEVREIYARLARAYQECAAMTEELRRTLDRIERA